MADPFGNSAEYGSAEYGDAEYGQLGTTTTPVSRDFDLPVAFSGFTSVVRDFDIPVAFIGIVSRDFDVPVAWTTNVASRETITAISVAAAPVTLRETITAISIVGGNGPLLVSWDVLAKYQAILPILWVVVNGGLFTSLPVAWTVVQQLASLPVMWNVIPNLVPDFSADVQMPVGEAEETP